MALPHYDTSYQGAPASWKAVRGVAELAESSGFDSVWVSDRLFVDWSSYGGPPGARGALECWTTMCAVAGATTSVRIGSLALCNELRHPAVLAKMAATLDLLSGGRLELGMGPGWFEPELGAAGIDLYTLDRRIDRLGEAAEIVARLLAGEDLTFAGRYYALQGAVCRPLPVQRPRPRVWIGGDGDARISTAIAAGDGWNFSWLGSVDGYRERVEVVERACEDAGRDPDTLARSVGIYLLVGRDERDARRRFERLAARTPAGVKKPDVNGEVSWEEFRRKAFAGTVTEVLDRLGKLVDLGVEEVVVTLGALPFQLSDREDVVLVGADVASQLK